MQYMSSVKIAKFSPNIGSDNIGDIIISESVENILNSVFDYPFIVNLSTRDRFGGESLQHIDDSDYRIIAGTNLLSSDMHNYRQWNIDMLSAWRMMGDSIKTTDYLFHPFLSKKKFEKNKVVLLGVGWWQYQEEPTKYTKKLLRILLDDTLLHSVRDRYTEEKLLGIGLKNVLYTACPTMWELNKEHCESIPENKADNVVCTLTYYKQDRCSDIEMIKTLTKNYKKVYLWLQSIEDYEYARNIGVLDKVEVIAPNLQVYKGLLSDKSISLDYVGTRLHGGILAIQNQRRSVIISVDNRATELAKDTKLPVLERKNIHDNLESIINRNIITNIELPVENIERWKAQFER